MKHGSSRHVGMIFSDRRIRSNKKFNENLEYLSSKLIINEYVSKEIATEILSTCLNSISHSNNNSIISAITKTFGKDLLY